MEILWECRRAIIYCASGEGLGQASHKNGAVVMNLTKIVEGWKRVLSCWWVHLTKAEIEGNVKHVGHLKRVGNKMRLGRAGRGTIVGAFEC